MARARRLQNHENAPPPRRRSTRRWRRLGLGLLGVAAVAIALALGGLLPIGTQLVRLKSPLEGEVVGLTGVEVVVHFTRDGRAEASTFRALLNGADVTEDFLSGENGAYGRLYGLLDGENRIRVEVFGRGRLRPDLLVEEAREVEVIYRPPLDLDRG